MMRKNYRMINIIKILKSNALRKFMASTKRQETNTEQFNSIRMQVIAFILLVITRMQSKRLQVKNRFRIITL
jgi:hypothetical protein